MMRVGRQLETLHPAFLGFLILFGALGACAPAEDLAQEDGRAPAEEPPVLQEESDGWVTGDAAEAGFDPATLEQLVVDIETGAFPNTHALLIEHDGALVFERYFSGTDERWGDYIPSRAVGPDSLHDLRSISKSVTSALLGIALATDLEGAVGRSMADYFPAFTLDEAQRSITLHHVLTMTAGLAWNEMTVPYTSDMNDEIRLYGASDPALYVMSRPVEHEPGSTWYYSGGLSQVLATVIFNLTNQRLDEYARARLFEPLGVTDFEWLGPAGWTPDNPAAMSGLRLRARDLAKIGSVYLHGGRWKGQQVVPEDWVERSMSRHVAEIGDWSDGGVWGYGYQWWVGALPSGERVVAGFGNGNQRLFILPDERLVVTILAGEYNKFEGHSERILDRVLAAR
jgi:CubicO group peptidase (beta-lactamase class C family)